METKENRDGCAPAALSAAEFNLRMNKRRATFEKTIYGENTPAAFIYADCDDTEWWIDWLLLGTKSQYRLSFSESDLILMMEQGGIFQRPLYRNSTIVYTITVEAPTDKDDPSNNDEAKQKAQVQQEEPMEKERTRESLVGKTVRVEWYGSRLMQGWQNAQRVSCSPSFCTTTGVVIEEADLAIVLGATINEGPFSGSDLFSPVIIARGAIARIEKLEVSKIIPNDAWQQH